MGKRKNPDAKLHRRGQFRDADGNVRNAADNSLVTPAGVALEASAGAPVTEVVSADLAKAAAAGTAPRRLARGPAERHPASGRFSSTAGPAYGHPGGLDQQPLAPGGPANATSDAGPNVVPRTSDLPYPEHYMQGHCPTGATTRVAHLDLREDCGPQFADTLRMPVRPVGPPEAQAIGQWQTAKPDPRAQRGHLGMEPATVPRLDPAGASAMPPGWGPQGQVPSAFGPSAYGSQPVTGTPFGIDPTSATSPTPGWGD